MTDTFKGGPLTRLIMSDRAGRRLMFGPTLVSCDSATPAIPAMPEPRPNVSASTQPVRMPMELAALSQLTNVGPNMGQAYIIDSFMVVVFGGVGNLWGTLVGAMSLGVVNKILEPWAGAVVAKILVLVFIILFIQKRPRGLFALKGRSVDMG